jgi:hypothetical protein
MPPRRIIFLSQDQYSKFNNKGYAIDTLKKRGFLVEFWDCSQILLPNFQGDKSPLDSEEFSGLRCFSKKSFLFNDISRLTSQDTIITWLIYGLKTWEILRHIANTKALWGMVRISNVPVSKQESSFQGRLQKIIRRPSIFANIFFQKLPLSKLGLRPLDFILQGGAATLLGIVANFKGAETKILDAHAIDYDRHLLSRDDSRDNNYPENIVFLDDGGPFHRDQNIFNVPFPCSTKEYFSHLNSFFRIVEKKFNCSVVVASHPRVQYDNRENPFEGRRIIQGETQKLVKQSKFVFSSCSTSVNFPVIYKKPIVFLSINPIKPNHYDNMAKNIAANLGKSPIHWAERERVDWEQELVINKDYYSQYMEAHIKKRGSAEIPCWEILANYLNSIAA